MTDQPQAPGPPIAEHVGDTPGVASATRRPVRKSRKSATPPASPGVASPARRRRHLPCPDCGALINRTALARHRRRQHAEKAPVTPPVETVRLTWGPMICFVCRGLIPSGTDRSTLAWDPSSRRKKVAHIVCLSPAAAGATAPAPEQQQPNPPDLASLGRAALTPLPLAPTPATPPTTPATSGDALLSAAELADLGIRAVRVEGPRRIVLELHEERAQETANRLVGPELADLTVCQTCRDVLGVKVSVPKSQMQAHDFEAHRDLWLKGRSLAESHAIKERKEQFAERSLPPGDP